MPTGHGQWVAMIHAAKGFTGTDGSHGGAQRADDRVHPPPGSIFGQVVEIHARRLQLGVLRQSTTGGHYHRADPWIGQRQFHDMAPDQPSRADEEQLQHDFKDARLRSITRPPLDGLTNRRHAG